MGNSVPGCGPGQDANIIFNNTDCACGVGIQSIAQSVDLTQLIITLTDGTSYTFPLPKSAPLTILFGTGAPAGSLGVVGQVYIATDTGNVYQKTGATTWTLEFNIIGPAGTSGTSLVWSNATDASTATTGSFVPLRTGSTDHTNAAKNLVNVGDYLLIEAFIQSASSATNSLVQLLFGTTSLIDFTGVGFPFSSGGGGNEAAKYVIKVTLTDNTAGAMKVRIESELTSFGQIPNFKATADYTQIQDFSGLDFATTDYTFTLQAECGAANDTVAKVWSCAKYSLTATTGGGSPAIKYITPFITTPTTQTYSGIVGSTGVNMKRIYLDGTLLVPSDWSYDNTTDALTFNITISSASEVQGDYL